VFQLRNLTIRSDLVTLRKWHRLLSIPVHTNKLKLKVKPSSQGFNARLAQSALVTRFLGRSSFDRPRSGITLTRLSLQRQAKNSYDTIISREQPSAVGLGSLHPRSHSMNASLLWSKVSTASGSDESSSMERSTIVPFMMMDAPEDRAVAVAVIVAVILAVKEITYLFRSSVPRK